MCKVNGRPYPAARLFSVSQIKVRTILKLIQSTMYSFNPSYTVNVGTKTCEASPLGCHCCEREILCIHSITQYTKINAVLLLHTSTLVV
jgi:hypothetical protein